MYLKRIKINGFKSFADETTISLTDGITCIVGPNGCGKTTLLNIIGGLDRYTSGELYVRHKPTASFTDRDWDSYRNHTIGFLSLIHI